MQFAFENLDVYKRSVSFVSKINPKCEFLKGKVPYSFIDQLIRASLSVSLNIAEGNGRWHKKEKKQFFWIARGSIFEIVPILQVLRNTGHLSESEYHLYYEDLRAMAMMTTNLIKSVDNLSQRNSIPRAN